MKKENQKKCEVKLTKCKGCFNSNHCGDCIYLDTNKPECSGSRYYKCRKRGSYHRTDECCCSSFVG